MRRALAAAAALVVALVLAACGSADGAPPPVYGADDTDIEVDEGQRFAITLEENPSVGDDWVVQGEPDPDVAALVDTDYDADAPDMIGSGGARTFTFEADGAGETTIVLHNCFRCNADGETPAEDQQYAETLTYDVRVGS